MTARRISSTMLFGAVVALSSGAVGYHLAPHDEPASLSTAPKTARVPVPVGTTTSTTDPAINAATMVTATERSLPVVSSTTSTIAMPRPAPTVAPRQQRAAPQLAVPVSDFGCAAALAYLAAHQAPGFVDVCRPHAASGRYGFTCVDHVPQCPGRKLIAIACPAPIVYKNEASNSWVLSGLSVTPIDPYGQNDRRCPPYA